MNKKKMVKMALVALCVFLGFVFVSIARAEVTESIVVENGRLIVYKTEVITTKTKTIAEEYVMPTFAVSGQGVSISEIRDIMKRGAGEYEFGRTEKTEWEWGFPMRSKTYETRTVYVFENGNWSSKPIVRIGPTTIKDDWRVYEILVIITGLTFLINWKYQQHAFCGRSFLGFFVATSLCIFVTGIVNRPIYAGAVAIIAVAAFTVGAMLVFLNHINQGDVELTYYCSLFAVAGYIVTSKVLILEIYGNPTVSNESIAFLAVICLLSYLVAKVAQITIWSEPEIFKK